ncbi:MAG: hypothetical protein IT376_16795 [Polyangiaceae bacterium]|nr:hypothetical protein [Polyangiaceae bacterium]
MSRLWMLCGFVVVAALGACEEKPKSEPKRAEDAGPEKPAIDPAVAKAMAAAEKAGQAAGGDGAGPPETGVFGPGLADKELPRGSAAKVTLGNAGAAPKVRLVAPAPGTKATFAFEISRKLRGAAQPPFELTLSLELPKPKADAPATPLLAGVLGIAKAAWPAAGVPKEEAAKVAKLKGSRVAFGLGATGGLGEPRTELSKEAAPELIEVAAHLGELFGDFLLPFPAEPVGVGGYWMATTRESVSGVEVLSFRMIKVRALREGAAELEVSGKRYAVGPRFDAGDVPKELGELSLEQLQAQSQGEVVVSTTTGLPASGTTTQVFIAVLSASGAPGKQLAPIQLQTTGVLRAP